jgi:hypothetical protein
LGENSEDDAEEKNLGNIIKTIFKK